MPAQERSVSLGRSARHPSHFRKAHHRRDNDIRLRSVADHRGNHAASFLGDDFSVTNAFLLITTLVADIVLSLLKLRLPRLEKLIDGLPLVLVEQADPCRIVCARAASTNRIFWRLPANTHGLERMDQIKYAVLEASGGISIVLKN